MDYFTLLTRYLIVVEVLAAVAGIFNWKNLSNVWRYFTSYLCAVVILEIMVRWIGKEHRNLFYSWTMPLHFLSFYFVYFHKLNTFKASVFWGAAIYMSSFFVEVIFNLKSGTFFSLNYTVGNIVLLLFTLFYFYEIALSDRILHFYSERMFWFACGIMIYYLGSLPYFGLFNYIRTNFLELMLIYHRFITVLNYFMYIFFVFSLLWPKKN